MYIFPSHFDLNTVYISRTSSTCYMVHPPFFFDFIIPTIIFLKSKFIMKLIIMQCSSLINYFLFLTPSSSHSYCVLHQSPSAN